MILVVVALKSHLHMILMIMQLVQRHQFDTH